MLLHANGFNFLGIGGAWWAVVQKIDAPIERLLWHPMVVRILSIEGNIAAGKSTFLAFLEMHLCERSDVVIVHEPLDQWEAVRDSAGRSLLELFYSDQKKYGFPFQMMAFISRLVALKAAIRDAGYSDVLVICERSLYCDNRVFAKMLRDDGIMNEVEHTIYLKWFDSFIADLPPHEFAYLRTSPGVAEDRAKLRDRHGENVPFKYLAKCCAYHEAWLTEQERVTVLDADVEKSPSTYRLWFSKVVEPLLPGSSLDQEGLAIGYC